MLADSSAQILNKNATSNAPRVLIVPGGPLTGHQSTPACRTAKLEGEFSSDIFSYNAVYHLHPQPRSHIFVPRDVFISPPFLRHAVRYRFITLFRISSFSITQIFHSGDGFGMPPFGVKSVFQLFFEHFPSVFTFHSADSHARARPLLPRHLKISSASVASSSSSSLPPSPSLPWRWRMRRMRSARASACVFSQEIYFKFC